MMAYATVRIVRLTMHRNSFWWETTMATSFVASANTRTVDWSYAMLSGIVAMIVFAIVEIAFSWAGRSTSPLAPLAVFGTATLNALMPSLHPGGGVKTAIVGIACLLVLGAVSGIILGYLVHRLGMVGAVLVGLAFGLAMFALDLYAIARVLPALVALRDWMSALAYVIQGVLAAALYKIMTREDAAVVPGEDAHDLRDLRHARLV
jgi:hypothetical protein